MGYVEQLKRGACLSIFVWNCMRDERVRHKPTYTATIHSILTESGFYLTCQDVGYATASKPNLQPVNLLRQFLIPIIDN